MEFNGLNIRKGLELEVPVKDIFRISTEPSGDEIALKLCNKSWDEIPELKNKKPSDLLSDDDDFLLYNSRRKKNKLNSYLDAYVRDSYLITYEKDKFGKEKIIKDIVVEIDFVNTKELNYSDFLKNIMEAQAFSGKYKSSFKHRFLGLGSFDMESYIDCAEIIAHSNLHLFDFFIFSKNILSSIGCFMSGAHIEDIRQQKEYFEKEEYNKVLENAERFKKSMYNDFFRNMDSFLK